MYSLYHFIWIGICITLIVISLIIIDKKGVSLKKLLPICCAISVVSEVIKTFSVFKLVPSADGSTLYPYLELQYLPLHMCSTMIFVIFYVTYSKNEKWKNIFYGLLYPTGILGGLLGILLPSIFSSVTPAKSFVAPLAYQTFIYHSMLFVLGITIYKDKESLLKSSNFKSSLILLSVMAFFSLYLNSLFANATYDNSTLVSVDYVTNFFFTYKTPIGIALNNKYEWYLYIFIIVVLAVVLVFIMYLPIFKKENKLFFKKKQSKS